MNALTTTDREQWLAQRRTGISGTDVSAILGINPWSSALDVWLDKRGQAQEREASVPMRVGTVLEPLVGALYTEQTGNALEFPGFQRHSSREWHIGTPDGTVPSAPALFEAKTARGGNDWGEPGTDQIPRYYLTQVAWYMSLLDLPSAHVAVLIGGSDFRVYTVARDMDLEAILLERCEAFWNRNVIGGEMPSVDGSKSASDYLAKRFPRNVEPLKVAGPEEIELAKLLAKVRAEADAIDATKTELENKLKQVIGEAEGLDLGSLGKITWKSSKASEKTDWKAVASALLPPPGLIATHTTTAPGSRRFLVSLKDAA